MVRYINGYYFNKMKRLMNKLLHTTIISDSKLEELKQGYKKTHALLQLKEIEINRLRKEVETLRMLLDIEQQNTRIK